MIDVQLITFDKENKHWLSQCRKGLESSYVTIYEGQAIKGNLNQARIKVWNDCQSDLLSFVDPDDIPVASAWEKLYHALQQNPNAGGAYTLEHRIGQFDNDITSLSKITIPNNQPFKKDNPISSPLIVHHLLVVRKSIYEMVRPYAETIPSNIEWLLAIAAFNRGGLIKVPEIGYYYRQHPGQTGSRINPGVANLGQTFLNWLNK